MYVTHVQERPSAMMKTDKRDALGLANTLYNQLALGIQVADKTQLVQKAFPPSATAAQLRGLIRHRYELVREATQSKNKLIAICDELFPEFTQILKDPNLPTALALRERFPTPAALATASLSALQEARGKARMLSDAKLLDLQRLAASSIGTKDMLRQRGLLIEQTQLIRELRLLQEHVAQLKTEITAILEQSVKDKSCNRLGLVQSKRRRSWLLLAPLRIFPTQEASNRMKQSGSTLDSTRQTHGAPAR